MKFDEGEVAAGILEIRESIHLAAEPAIAERDRSLLEELRGIVGKSGTKAKEGLAMDGARSQNHIHRQIGVDKRNLSTLVEQLQASRPLTSDSKTPKLVISVPFNVFVGDSPDER